MKKLIIAVLAVALVLCFAACTKEKNKGEIYTPPQTEVVTFEDGLTAVFEVVTEANGEPATDAEGETQFIPYIPPVTEEGGYLVTDAQGSTVPDIPTVGEQKTDNATTRPISNDFGDLDETDSNNKETQAGKPDSTTAKNEKPEKTTLRQETTTAKAEKPTEPHKTDPTTAKTEKPTDAPQAETTTGEIDGELTSAKAKKLVGIMEGVANPFEDALVEGDFYGAEKTIDAYIANIEAAVKEIKSDKALYEFVGNQQLDLWLNSMYDAKENFKVFMSVYRHEEGKTEKNPLFYKAYADFQDSYKASLQAYYFILFAAKDRV